MYLDNSVIIFKGCMLNGVISSLQSPPRIKMETEDNGFHHSPKHEKSVKRQYDDGE